MFGYFANPQYLIPDVRVISCSELSVCLAYLVISLVNAFDHVVDEFDASMKLVFGKFESFGSGASCAIDRRELSPCLIELVSKCLGLVA